MIRTFDIHIICLACSLSIFINVVDIHGLFSSDQLFFHFS